jgi:5-formyltetrahydrofolate cyclo-ligase
LSKLRATKPVHAVGVAHGVCEVDRVPYETHDQSLDAVVTEQETILIREQ